MDPTAENISDLASKRLEKEARSELFADIESGVEPEWTEAVVPESWARNGRKFFLRGATVGERSMLFNRGFSQGKDEHGEPTVRQNAYYVPLLIALCLHWDNPATGRRERVFDPKQPQELALINRYSGKVIDDLVKTATQLSGLAREDEKKAKENFTKEEEIGGFDFE